MAFMFESSFFIRTTKFALDDEILEHDKNYYKCWQGLEDHFDPNNKAGK